MQASLLCRIAVKNTRPSVFSTQGPFIITTKLNALLRFSCDVGPNITGGNGTWLGDTGTPFGAFVNRGYVTGNGGGSGSINRMGFDASLSSSQNFSRRKPFNSLKGGRRAIKLSVYDLSEFCY